MGDIKCCYICCLICRSEVVHIVFPVAGMDSFVSLCPMRRFFLKFFLKCNQNCLKNAGNPRDMRRFQVSGFTVRANALPTTVFQGCFAKLQTCRSILQLRTNKAHRVLLTWPLPLLSMPSYS